MPMVTIIVVIFVVVIVVVIIIVLFFFVVFIFILIFIMIISIVIGVFFHEPFVPSQEQLRYRTGIEIENMKLCRINLIIELLLRSVVIVVVVITVVTIAVISIVIVIVIVVVDVFFVSLGRVFVIGIIDVPYPCVTRVPLDKHSVAVIQMGFQACIAVHSAVLRQTTVGLGLQEPRQIVRIHERVANHAPLFLPCCSRLETP
mmetsp:Transcript_13899/g.29094  ORF Transcript_13899/g.29094 Transcript_13899/m.29094 type:complete len:202 (-) Transcript_13899:23-628(-)